MHSTKMRPVVPIPKRTNGFSIDSIMGRDDGDKPSVSSGDESDQGDESTQYPLTSDDVRRLSIGSRIPPLHPSLPAHVKQLLLNDVTGRAQQDLLFHPQSWAFGSQHVSSFPALGVSGAASMGIGPHMSVGLQAPGPQFHPGLLSSAASPRDPMSMYPWMLARQGAGLLGLPYGHPEAGLFFHPYRKPKRIRTAFSPAQLLKLELAFEKNHYVVGQERKDLAAKLNLTETQVKVWFQNRRTKHKRVRSDDEMESENISIDDEDIGTSTNDDDMNVRVTCDENV